VAVGLGRLAAVAALAAALGACAGPTVPPPPPPDTAVPDLRGTWTGTWAGTPVTLLIAEQAEGGERAGGFYVGTAHVLGERQPTVAGVLTFRDPTGTTTTHARGWVGVEGRRLRLLVVATPGAGNLALDLAVEPDGRLVGTGESDFRWGPRGPITLTRR
jgi:hypothetical protein